MAEEYEKHYKVFEIVRNKQVRDFEPFYGLVFVQAFEEEAEAERHAMYDGEKGKDYAIIKVIRRK